MEMEPKFEASLLLVIPGRENPIQVELRESWGGNLVFHSKRVVIEQRITSSGFSRAL
jgi:hypothetical protein